VFGIDWLRTGIPVAKETSVLEAEAEVVADARRRAPDLVKRHPGREPDGFRLADATVGFVECFPFGSERPLKPCLLDTMQ
jgi:hypothetical protein